MRNKSWFKKGFKPPKEWAEATRAYWAKVPKKRIVKVCELCKKDFSVYPYRIEAKFCSGSCRSKMTGKIRRDNAVPILHSGYMFIRMNSYHRTNKMGYAKIADLVLEKKIGRKLRKNEIAHHIDRCKTNDSPENLQLMTKREHDRFHLSEYCHR